MSEELPDRGEGEAERDWALADRSKRQRLTTKEKTVLTNCERPMGIEEWREMTPERQRETLEKVKMA